MKRKHKDKPPAENNGGGGDASQTQQEPQNLAAAMIRKKLESVEAINSNLSAEHTHETLDPAQHAAHAGATAHSSSNPAVIDPSRLVKSKSQAAYHDNFYKTKGRNPFSRVTAIAPQQVLHKSSEKLKKIKPPKEYLEAQKAKEKEAHEIAKQTAKPQATPQTAQPQQHEPFPAQRTSTEPSQKNPAPQHLAPQQQRPSPAPLPNPQPPAPQAISAQPQQHTVAPRPPRTAPIVATPEAPQKPTIQKYAKPTVEIASAQKPPAITIGPPIKTKSPPEPKPTPAAEAPPNEPPQRSSTLRKKEPADKSQKIGFRKPIMIAMIFGFATLVVNYNEIAVAQVKQYITPSSAISTPVITDPNAQVEVSGEARIIIPKINVDVPVVYDVTTFEESAIQAGLERGVVHYGTTALPGQVGNNVIVGHSSNNFFNTGKYKFAFVLLDRLETGDTFALHYQGQRYVYEIFEDPKIIEPTDFSVVQPTNEPITTLITCSPPGTSWRRLVVRAKQILPDPNSAQVQPQQDLPQIEGPVPGNPESFWSRIF